MTNNGGEKKDRGPNRYPLKDHEAAKRTIARLTREVLRGDKDPEKVRAAIYCINSLIQIFKIEAVQNIKFTGEMQASVKKPEMTEEELQKAIDELIPGYEEYLQWAENKRSREAIERNRVKLPAPEPKPLPEPEPEAIVPIEDMGAKWKPAGIGARRNK
jgi:hypothetical protein